MIKRTLPLLLMFLVSCQSCQQNATVGVPVSPREAFKDNFLAIFKDANSSYEEALKTVYRARKAGLISEDTELKATALGDKARLALEAARTAAIAYVQATDATDAQSRVYASFANALKLVGDLTTLISTFKPNTTGLKVVP